MANNFGHIEEHDGSDLYADPEDPELVVKAKRNVEPPLDFSYAEKDVILYNLGVGATEKELHWTFEGDSNFSALPTFGVIPQFMASGGISLDWLPNYNPVRTECTLCDNLSVTLLLPDNRLNYCMGNNTLLSKAQFRLAQLL